MANNSLTDKELLNEFKISWKLLEKDNCLAKIIAVGLITTGKLKTVLLVILSARFLPGVFFFFLFIN